MFQIRGDFTCKIMAVILCCFLFITAVTGLQNVARGKPAKQSSTAGDAVASRAVDGNTNPYLDGGSCSSTEAVQSSWWSLDLGEHYSIKRIRITTSKDGPPPSHLYVDASNSSGATEMFFSLDSSLAAGQIVDIIKPRPFRANHVYMDTVYTSDTPKNLTICEVEIYEYLDQQYFHMDDKRGASSEILRHKSRSKIECADFCLSKDTCRSFLWQPSTKECILYEDNPSTTSSPDGFLGFVTL